MVQLEAGKADVSMAAVFNPEARIAKGPVTVRDIAGLYVYENTLVVLEVTGQQLKDALEHSAKYFRSYEPGKSPAELVDEKIPAYNLTRRRREQVVNLQADWTEDAIFSMWKPFQTRNFACSNKYRVNGGGGTMYKGAPVVTDRAKRSCANY